MDWLPLILFSVFIGWVLYSNFTKKGKAQVRGGEIEKTFDDFEENSEAFFKQRIKVHVLESTDESEKRIVIEYLTKSKMHWQSMDLNFSIEEVKQMNKLLLQALDYSNTET
tara:strand:+ start:1380 stop:1712 length:333 start_codon:yes stop_codon:yes gene_type:complete